MLNNIFSKEIIDGAIVKILADDSLSGKLLEACVHKCIEENLDDIIVDCLFDGRESMIDVVVKPIVDEKINSMRDDIHARVHNHVMEYISGIYVDINVNNYNED